jgi:hypothetical protein
MREEAVRHLMSALSDEAARVLAVDPSISATEVISAYLTLARNAVIAARSIGVSAGVLRDSVQQIYVECYDPHSVS